MSYRAKIRMSTEEREALRKHFTLILKTGELVVFGSSVRVGIRLGVLQSLERKCLITYYEHKDYQGKIVREAQLAEEGRRWLTSELATIEE